MADSNEPSKGHSVRALVYENRPRDGAPYCGEYRLAAVPALGTSLNIVKRGYQAATGGKIIEVCFFGVPLGKSDEAAIAVTFKR